MSSHRHFRAAAAAVTLSLAAAAATATTAAAATPPTPLDPSTVANLDAALHQEAFDWTSYTLFGEQAAREGQSSAAGLLTNSGNKERTDHLAALATVAGTVGTNEQNLQTAIDGETYEATTMYPDFAATARAEGCTQVATRFQRIGREEWMHAQKYRAALIALQKGSGSIPRAGSINVATAVPTDPACGGQTLKNLYTAMKGESLAAAKYYAFADKARATGNARLAALFEGTAKVEFREHMTNQALLSGLLDKTKANLTAAADRENAQATTTYPSYAAQAAAAGDSQVAALFTSIANDEAALRDAFTAAAARLP